MATFIHRIAILAAGATVVATVAQSELLPGTTGSTAGDTWQSSWLDLKPPLSFKKGEALKLQLEGSAENVLVRLLPSGSPPDSPDGIDGNPRKVPKGGTLNVTLERDHPDTSQISVHAGKTAWGRPLGGNNGTVKVISIERSSP